MKKFIAMAVITAIVFSAATPSFAQRAKRPTLNASGAQSGAVFADFAKVEAISGGSGVAIRWTMRSERRVVGYRVYRVGAKGNVLINDRFVPATFGGSPDDVRSGEQYSDFDPVGRADSSYLVEALGIDAKSALSGPATAKYQPGAASLVATAEMSAEARASTDSSETLTPTNFTPETNAPAPDPIKQRDIAARPGAKIGVKKDGFYRVMRAELQAAGFNLSVSSANWRLYTDGNEQAIVVGPNDEYIEFYGRALDTAESDTRTYYLIADTDPGLRYGDRSMKSFGGTVYGKNSWVTLEKKERSLYVPSHINGTVMSNGVDHFWSSRIITTSPITVPFTVPNPDTTSASNATLTVKIFGYSTSAHSVKLTLNGHLLSTQATGSYQEPISATVDVPASYLVDGVNSLQLAGTVGGEICLYDSVRLTYQEKFLAYQNQVSFVAPTYKKVDLAGFSSPTVSTVTISDGSVAVSTDTTPAPASSTRGVLRLSALSYAGGEVGSNGNPGIARIVVSRVFGNSGPVTANLTLTNGTATGSTSCTTGVDYIFPADPVVTLADGVANQNVDVVLCNDGVADAGETFTATLSNPTGGATLAQPNVRVIDLTYESAPRLVSGLQTTQNGSTYGVTIPSARGGIFYAVDESYMQQAASVTANNPSTIATPGAGAEMIIISYSAPDFMAAANSWATYRRSAAGGSFTVRVVDVADVYDEFNYGAPTAASIKSFLSYAATNWQTPARYVLLLGDGSYDPRNYENTGAWALVPTKMVNLIYAESGSDEGLADFNEDGLAEMPIGRIPARTGAAINLALSKTQAFETAQMQSFARGALFANDVPNGYDFEGMSHILRDELPPEPTMHATFVSYGSDVNSPDPAAQGNLINAMNAGPYIVNYSGHGSGGLWSSSAFFGTPNVAQLTNPNQSIYTMLTCLNGYFLRPNSDCLAEVLLQSSGGGAVAAWASAEKTTPDIQLIMGQRFYNQLNAGSLKRMGDLVRDAKLQIPGGSDVRLSWVLLGDPALQVRP
jgi:hypothetical protein